MHDAVLTGPARSPRPASTERPPAGIAAVGSALPPRAVANETIAERLGLDATWIASRTGVHERRVAAPDQTLVDLATEAGAVALERAGVAAADVDLVLVATFTNDRLLPNAAPLVASRLGAQPAGAVDLGAACTGFISGLQLAAGAVESGRSQTALVIGADLISRLIDYDDRRTAGLFGDGAGAVVISPGAQAALGPFRLHSDAAESENITTSHEERKVRMDGRATFRQAVARMSEVTLEVCDDAGISLDEIDLFIYHQANSRILTAVGERLGLDAERVVDSIALRGNTSAATIPIALDEALGDGRVADRARILLGAFGAGLTWGAGIVEWGGGREAGDGS
jgi:3-oxoacyl-[acyl-carrier-protein] synthase-3